jgi:acetyl esterase/lipase
MDAGVLGAVPVAGLGACIAWRVVSVQRVRHPRERVRGRAYLAGTAVVVTIVAGGFPGPVSAGPTAGAVTNQAATPVLSASPSSGLVDGQRIGVTGTGFAAGTRVAVYQCRAAPVGLVDCELGTGTAVTADDAGSFTLDLQVFAVIYDVAAAVDCRADPGCVLVADMGFDGGASAVVAPLSFDPAATLLPPPSISVTPGSDLVDGQTVRVEGQGFVHRMSSELVLPEEPRQTTVRLHQCGRSEWGPLGDCRAGPTQVVELGDDGTFTTELPVSAVLRGHIGLSFDCRSDPEPCLLLATMQRPHSFLTAQTELHFDPEAPLAEQPRPEITVTPDTGLHDFEEVSVTGTHFTPGGTVQLAICRADDPQLCGDAEESPSADAAGNIDVAISAWADFEFPRPFDCRQAPGCVVRATDLDRGADATTPLTFGPPDGPHGRYVDPIFPDVQVDRDIIYRETVDARGNPVQLALDIYRPAGDTATSRPAYMWMHPGFFTGGSKDSSREAAELARRGYVGVSIDYRLRPFATDRREQYLASLDAYDDAVAAVEWLESNAADYGIDPDAIIAAGTSAGAVTALNLAYLSGQRGPTTSPVAAAAADSGLLYAAPERGDPPAIAFHGTLDTVTPYDNVRRICDHAGTAGVGCELASYDGRDHGAPPRDVVHRSAVFLTEQVLEPLGYFDLRAAANGPYEVDEGSTVTLDGSGSTGEQLSFAWTPAARVDDPASATPHLIGRDDGTATVTLTVTNNHGISATDQAQVTTHNVAPAVGPLGTTVSPDGTVSLLASVTDPGLSDTHSALVHWGDGTTGPATVDQHRGSAGISGTHHYARSGSYRVTVTVSDDDGGTATRTATVAVSCGTPGDDACVVVRPGGGPQPQSPPRMAAPARPVVAQPTFTG